MNSKFSDDLDYLRDVAESGENAPSLSGRFSLLWFGLLSVALLAHWALARGLVPGVPEQYVGFIWLGYAIVGMAGSTLISHTLKDKPGQSASINRLDRTGWPVVGAGLFVFALSILAAVSIRGVSVDLFDAIMPTAFLVYAVRYAGRATFERGAMRWAPVVISIIAASVTVFLFGTADVYLAAAFGVAILWLASGYPELRNEPASIV